MERPEYLKYIWNNTIQYSGAAVRKVPIPVFSRCFLRVKYWKLYIFHGNQQRPVATWLSSKYLAFNVLFDSDRRSKVLSVRWIWGVFSQESNDRVRTSPLRLSGIEIFLFLTYFLTYLNLVDIQAVML